MNEEFEGYEVPHSPKDPELPTDPKSREIVVAWRSRVAEANARMWEAGREAWRGEIIRNHKAWLKRMKVGGHA